MTAPTAAPLPETEPTDDDGGAKPDSTVSVPESEPPPSPAKPPKPGKAGSEEKTADAVTPMMAQYLSIKTEHPDSLLFYRMGDFYELFFEDAVHAAAALDIALTKRGKHLGDDIPMCGVPVHSHETYLNRLIQKGFRVAVCEQTEDPAEARKRGSKAVVNREVMRVVTPGTLSEETLLDARRNNYLAAVAETGGARGLKLGLSWIDMSTGIFLTQNPEPGDLGAALARIQPGELLVPDGLLQNPDHFETFSDWKECLSPLPSSRFDSANGTKRLQAFYGVKTLDAFGEFSRPELAAAGALLDYLELTQKGRLPRLSEPRQLAQGEVLEIDAATRRNLELTASLTGSHKNTLLGVIDRTLTGAGARLLSAHLAAPLTDPQAIVRRLDMVQHFTLADRLRDDMEGVLRRCPDMERALSRLTLGRGGPRDLAAVRDGLGAAEDIRALFGNGAAEAPEGITGALGDLGHHDEVIERLARALAPELPMYARDGGFIAQGYAPELDELRKLRDESRRMIAGLQSRYAEETAIPALKIKHNNVLGFYIEVSAKNADKIPLEEGSPFIHRQTMASAVRYSTVELGDLESRIAKAADQALALEMTMFEDLVLEVTGRADSIALAARAQARLDVARGLAVLATDARYVRPDVDASTDFFITGGRHPVVEAALAESAGEAFIANDCRLIGGGTSHDTESGGGEGSLWLLTGPNMAGKSTFLRQNALIAVLAQMGSFVPAEQAKIGVVDRLFSRVGAADDLARGRSTFMVEMVETAAILNQAGPRALVILDEIGRGTATFDGLSIAWAVVEHLHEKNRCRALFATHYHELTALASRLDGLNCHTMRVKEWKDDVVFLHEVGPGAADRSYGIHVGALAGLPKGVVQRASEVLETLEQGEQSSAMTRLADDLPLFHAMRDVPGGRVGRKEPSRVEQTLAGLDADALTPREALEAIYALKEQLETED